MAYNSYNTADEHIKTLPEDDKSGTLLTLRSRDGAFIKGYAPHNKPDIDKIREDLKVAGYDVGYLSSEYIILPLEDGL